MRCSVDDTVDTDEDATLVGGVEAEAIFLESMPMLCLVSDTLCVICWLFVDVPRFLDWNCVGGLYDADARTTLGDSELLALFGPKRRDTAE